MQMEIIYPNEDRIGMQSQAEMKNFIFMMRVFSFVTFIALWSWIVFEKLEMYSRFKLLEKS